MNEVQRRLAGSSGNRVYWRAEDVKRVAERLGRGGETSAVPAAPAIRAGGIEMETRAGGTRPSFTFTISTPSVDRMGDTIAVEGWQLEAYRKNPVVLWMHDNAMLPVGRSTRVWREGKALKAVVEIASDLSGFAARVAGLIEGGQLRAASVGFRPLKWNFAEEAGRKFGIDFHEAELLEWSIVTVPANAEALLDSGEAARKAAAVRQKERELELIRLRGAR